MGRLVRARLSKAIVLAFAMSLVAPTIAQGAIPRALEDVLPAITKSVDRFRGIELRPSTLAPLREDTYGVADGMIVEQFNSAKDAELQTADAVAQQPGFSEEDAEAVRKCFIDGFKGVAEDYRTAEQDQTGPPVFFDSFSQHAATCLASTYSGVSSDFLEFAEGLAAQAVPPAETAYRADGSHFPNWLAVTGGGTDTTPETGPGPTETPPIERPVTREKKDSSVPTWVWVIAGLIALGLIGYALDRAGKQRNGG